MGIPWVQNVSSTGGAAPYMADWMESPFELTYQVNLGTVTCTYTLEATLDNPNTVSSPLWTVVSSGTTSEVGAINTSTTPPGPIQALRIRPTSLPSGTITLTVLQGISAR